MKFLIAVFLPASPFIAPSPFINFGDFCQPPRLLHTPRLLFWPKFASLPVYSALSFYLKLESSLLVRSSHMRCSARRKNVLRNFAEFTGKLLCQSLFLKKTFIKKQTLAQVFSFEFCEISKSTFFTEHFWTVASFKREKRENQLKFHVFTILCGASKGFPKALFILIYFSEIHGAERIKLQKTSSFYVRKGCIASSDWNFFPVKLQPIEKVLILNETLKSYFS